RELEELLAFEIAGIVGHRAQREFDALVRQRQPCAPSIGRSRHVAERHRHRSISAFNYNTAGRAPETLCPAVQEFHLAVLSPCSRARQRARDREIRRLRGHGMTGTGVRQQRPAALASRRALLRVLGASAAAAALTGCASLAGETTR